MVTIYCYSKCSTCKKAVKFLEENNINHTLKDIVKEHPTKEEMTNIIKRSDLDIKKFFNTSGNVYKILNLKDKLITMNEDEKISLLVTDGMLMKRPLVVSDNHILTGFNESIWKETLI